MSLVLDNVSKKYGATQAVTDFSLEMNAAEILCLLGPSGCGKTTTLRLISGLEFPDQGRIGFDGHDITDVAPQKRRFGMVFQSYALFPHMNVFENVAFGLRALGVGKGEIRERVRKALELLQIDSKFDRRIQDLSGGEQQRVAVARAVVIEPRLLLLDEPLSNLDAVLRETTRTQLRQLIRRLRIGAVFVTHDQEEAFALGDRVAVMKSGRLQQLGTPSEIYERPANLFVAQFMGKSNVLDVSARNGSGQFSTGDLVWKAGRPAERSGSMHAFFRPDQVQLGGAGINSATVEIVDLQRTIRGLLLVARLEAHLIEVQAPMSVSDSSLSRLKIGDQVQIYVPPDAIHLFPHE
ncbi:MAG TPA: ABC transporter ATP-binding protein [Acidobacteriota bacterium]|jgi:ABC-type Fe3+/spermidine/putrescine transport system ATPase subunit